MMMMIITMTTILKRTTRIEVYNNKREILVRQINHYQLPVACVFLVFSSTCIVVEKRLLNEQFFQCIFSLSDLLDSEFRSTI